MVMKHKTRAIGLGSVPIGGGAPVSVQSMLNTDPRDVEACIAQIRELARVGCDIVRVAVPDFEAVEGLPALVGASPIPVVADVHFDFKLALAAIGAGVHGLRVNPGNLGGRERGRAVARAAAEAGVAVRIGVNAGSLDRAILSQFGGATAEALAQSALENCALFEAEGCSRLKVSVKVSDVATTVQAYRCVAARSDYPLHVGVTEAGTPTMGRIKSAVAIGALLLDGIGDTIRVSLTAAPVQEVYAGIQILQAVGLRPCRPDIVSCPTCGRTRIDLVPLVEAVEAEVARLRVAGMDIDLGKVAIMGCEVNGPGEARDADLGIAGGNESGVLFEHGKVVKRIPADQLKEVLIGEIRKHAVPRG